MCLCLYLRCVPFVFIKSVYVFVFGVILCGVFFVLYSVCVCVCVCVCV